MEMLVDMSSNTCEFARITEFSGFVDRLDPAIEKTIDGLRGTSFREDPIAGRRYSRATSIMSSAYKRHGQLLEHAILERLKECSRLTVWREEHFKLSHASKVELQKHERVEPCLRARLAYGDCERATPVDMIVHDAEALTLRAYNVKRGNGTYDGGKRRIILDGLVRTHMLLHGYGMSKGIDAAQTQAHIVFYYGVRSIGEPFSIVAKELDDHFSFPVHGAVEAVNARFRERLHALIEETED